MADTFLNIYSVTDDGELLAAFGGAVTEFFNLAIGGVDTQLQILLYLIIIDFVLGFIAGSKEEGYCSRKCGDGIMRKFLIILIVSMAHVLGVAFEMEMLRHMAIIAFLINESGSILENITRLGYGKIIPSFLKSALKVAKEIENEKEKNLRGRDIK